MLEVETTGDPIDIKQLPHQEQAGLQTALHRGHVHFPQRDPSGGHEFLPEGSPSGDHIAAVPQGRDQALLGPTRQIGPALLGVDRCLGKQMQPEPPAEFWPRPPVGQLPAGLSHPGLGKAALQIRLGASAAPVDPQLTAIPPIPQIAGREGGQPQNRGPTQASMGDQHGPPLPLNRTTGGAAGPWGSPGGRQQLQGHRIHGDPGQILQRVVLQSQAEQGRYRRHQPMAQGSRQPMATRVAAGGQHQLITGEHGPIPEGEQEAALGPPAGSSQRLAGAEADTGGSGRPPEGGHHGRGSVGTGKHAAIGLLHQFEPMGVEPGHGVAAGEAGEGTPQGLASAGIVTHERPGIPAGMGHIASAAAADQHLVQGLGGGLQHQDVPHPGLSRRDRRHEPGRSTSGHNHGRMARQHGGMTHSYRFSVAPMLDCTDRHFRVLMRQVSRHCLLYSEMVVARALHHICQEGPTTGSSERQRRLERLLGFDAEEKPLALQLGGDDPQLLARAARLGHEWGYDEINLNVGCPSEKVQQGRFGACLMAEPDQVARCVEAMGNASPLPVTVKHRIGIDDRDSFEELRAFVDTVAAAGCHRFAVHARKAWLEGLDPKQNRTIPPLRWDLVHQLKRERPALIVELNGGLEDLSDCLNQLQLVDGVMVGRAAYAHPLRWRSVDGAIFGDESSQPVTASAVLRGLLPHAERWCSGGGRLWAIGRHLVHVVEGVSGARHWRANLTRNAGMRTAGPEVLEAAARQLEERGY